MMAAALGLALVLDALFGWPDWLFRRIGHPVSWLGHVISAGERFFNQTRLSNAARRINGVVLALGVIVGVVVLAIYVTALLPGGAFGVVLTGILAWPLVAARSLHDHVAAVAHPLQAGDLEGARAEIAKIVGRDPALLDEGGMARAAVETLAENASDGVVAPLFWGALFGLPGIAAYKAINTMDSMIGYRNARYEQFGWAAARIDDLANLLPARITGVLIALVSPLRQRAFGAMLRDAKHHRSPNAGWPEAAMAGALGVRLSGPRSYGDGMSDDPYLNPEGDDPGASQVFQGLWLFRRAVALAGFILVAVALVAA